MDGLNNKKVKSEVFIEAIEQEKPFSGELKIEDEGKLREIFKRSLKKAKKSIDYHGSLYPDFWEDLKEDILEAVRRVEKIRFLMDKRLDVAELKKNPKVSWIFGLPKKYPQKVWIAQAKTEFPHLFFIDEFFFRSEKAHEINEICNENFIAVKPKKKSHMAINRKVFMRKL